MEQLAEDPSLASQVEWLDEFQDLAYRLMGARSVPQRVVSSLSWNAQQDLESARNLELGQRIRVFTDSFEQDAVITGISHDISPAQWMITLDLTLP